MRVRVYRLFWRLRFTHVFSAYPGLKNYSQFCAFHVFKLFGSYKLRSSSANLQSLLSSNYLDMRVV
jgi:hypothetical protein